VIKVRMEDEGSFYIIASHAEVKWRWRNITS